LTARIESTTCRAEAFTLELARLGGNSEMVKRDLGFDIRQRGAMPPKQRSSTEMSTGYETLLSNVSELLQRGRQNAAKSINAILTTTYWLVGRRLVEFEQRGKEGAVYGSELLKRLSGDL